MTVSKELLIIRDLAVKYATLVITSLGDDTIHKIFLLNQSPTEL